MIFFAGSRPSMKAGSAIEAQVDFRLRGGMVISSRVVSPLATFWRAWATASMHQLCENLVPGLTVLKTF